MAQILSWWLPCMGPTRFMPIYTCEPCILALYIFEGCNVLWGKSISRAQKNRACKHNSSISTRNNATRTIILPGGKDRLNSGKEIYINTKAIYEFINLEACIILTIALDVELAFWFIKQLFYSTLCLNSSPHRCIKVTNVSNKEKHYESYLIQFCLKDLLYVCVGTRTQKKLKKI